MNTTLYFIKEMFAPSTTLQTTIPTESETSSSSSFSTPFIIGFVLFCILCLIYNIGAVRLSWCYNTAAGTSLPLKVIYAILSFFFSSFYYPLYAFFLDEKCAQETPVYQIGGSRRHRKH